MFVEIPQFIYEYERSKRSNKSKEHKFSSGRLCVTQPRRVAAMSLAKRVAQEMNEKLGGVVGYSVRFEEMTSKDTMIKYLTDGMLLRELLSDQNLTKYSAIILDEAHERTLRTDILFGMIKKIQISRPASQPLKVIIMSATLDPRRFESFFKNVGTYRVPGRMFPVKLFYTVEPVQDYIDTTILTIFQIHTDSKNSGGGDILVFLTGQEEIESVQKTLEEYGPQCPVGTPKMIVCPIFASLPSHQQMSVFQQAPSGCRKIILATNIAETSITISGIRFVIDTGFVKIRQYNSRTGMEALIIQPVSKSSARQRTGRAGRETAGECYRLFPEESFLKLEDESVPEILRTNLSNVILIMKACGIENVFKFDYLDPPGLDCLQRGMEELLALGALDYEGNLSSIGKLMAECPLIPQLSRVLLEANKLQCLEEALSIISMLSSDTIFFSSGEDREKTSAARKTFQHRSGDHLTLLNVYNTFLAHRSDPKWCSNNYIDARSMKHVCDVRQQLVDFCTKAGMKISSCNGAVEKVLQSFVSGYFLQSAIRLADGTYKTITSKQHVHIHPSSIIFGTRPDCIIFHEITLTSKCYLRGVSSVEATWIQEQTFKAQPKPKDSVKGVKSISF
jgi:HrpA-like RNA helicase